MSWFESANLVSYSPDKEETASLDELYRRKISSDNVHVIKSVMNKKWAESSGPW